MKRFLVDSSGRVALRNVSQRTLDKEYIYAGRYYVYRKARFELNSETYKWEWIGAKRKNRRFGHKAAIYVRAEPSTGRAIPVRFDTYFYPADQKDQPSPFPELHETFWVTTKAKKWIYEYHDFGGYDEEWRVGLLSDILHAVMYNRGKDMTEGKWKLWRIPEYENKVDVKLPERKPRGVFTITDFDELIDAINHAFEKELKGEE